MLTELGAAKLIESFKEFRGRNPKDPIFDPIFVFTLEYQLLKDGRTDDAKLLHNAFRDLGVKNGSMFTTQAWFGEVSKNYPFAEECLTMLLTLEPDHAEAKKTLEEIRKKMAARPPPSPRLRVK